MKKMNAIKNYTLATLLSGAALIGCQARVDECPKTNTPDQCASEILEVHEHLDEHFAPLDSTNTNFLECGAASTPAGSTIYTQHIQPGQGQIVYEEDERDVIGHFLHFNDGANIFTYEMRFDDGLKAAQATDLIGTQLNIIGKDYEITNATLASNDLTLFLHALDNTRDVTLKNTLNDMGNPGTVVVDGEIIEDAHIHFQGSTQQGVRVDLIRYGLRADAILGDIYVPAGQQLSAQLDEPEGLLGFDMHYDGLSIEPINLVRLDFVGQDEIDLEFFNREGLFYDLPLASNETGVLKWGDDDDNLHYREKANIENDDFFILNGNSNFTHVLRYDAIDTTNQRLTFTDLGTGTLEIWYDAAGTGTLLVGGDLYAVQRNPDNTLRIDLNGDGFFNSPEPVQLHELNGLEITLDEAPGAKYILFHMPGEHYDGCVGGESFGFAALPMPGNTLETSLIPRSDITLYQDEVTLDHMGMNRYGIHVDHYQGQSDVNITIPQRQLEAFVRFTGQ